MIKQNCITLEFPNEWREALHGIPHSFGHTWENCYAMHLSTGFKTYLYSFEKDDIRIVCPIAERRFGSHVDILKPFGFSGFVGNGGCFEFENHWENFVRERGYVCGYLGLNPVFDFGSHFKPEDIYQYDTVYVLDLTPSTDELFANMSNNRQRQLKNWDEISSNLVFNKNTLWKFFLDNYLQFFRRKNAESYYFFEKSTVSFLLNLGNVKLVGMRTSGKIVSVSVFSYTKDAGDYLFNVSLPEGQEHTAALVWYGINYLKSLHIPSINLGGGSSGEFKRRFGTRDLPLRCLKQVYRPEIYEKLCRQVNADPTDKTGFFPAYRKKEFDMQNQRVKLG